MAKGNETMNLQGTQLDVLQTIADIQQATFTEDIEDLEIAEEADLDIRLVRNALDALANEGYVKVEKIKTLSGLAYSAFLRSQGKIALVESQSLMIEKL